MPNQLFPKPSHDHGTCVEGAIARARQVCETRGIRLTALREAVLRVLTGSHKALGAYEIIDKMTEQGRRLAPISVYRIIDVLVEAGLVHRLESKNAFFACLSRHENTASMVVLLCEACHRVAETEAGRLGRDQGHYAGYRLFRFSNRSGDPGPMPRLPQASASGRVSVTA